MSIVNFILINVNLLIFTTFRISVVDVKNNISFDKCQNREIKLDASKKKKYDKVRELQAVRWENINVEDHQNYTLVGPFTENTVDESQCHPIIPDSGEVADTGHTCNKMVGSKFKISNYMLIYFKNEVRHKHISISNCLPYVVCCIRTCILCATTRRQQALVIAYLIVWLLYKLILVFLYE